MGEFPTTEEMEKGVLAVLESEEDYWFNYFNSDIVKACGGDLNAAKTVCKHLRSRKKIAAQGRGEYAQYGHKAGE